MCVGEEVLGRDGFVSLMGFRASIATYGLRLRR
jgi:hypothetical protein